MILMLPTASKSLEIKICKYISKDPEIKEGGREEEEGRKRKGGREGGRKTAGAHPPPE